MHLSVPTRRVALLVFALLPSVVFAHPGHDGDHGGGLVWDFVGEVVHRLSHPYHLLPTLGLALLFVFGWRMLRAKRRGGSAEKGA